MNAHSFSSNSILRKSTFIHFLDLHHLGLISTEPCSTQVILEAKRAITIALLLSKNIYIPAASYFESSLCSNILQKLSPLFETGCIWLVGSAPTLEDFWLLHKNMYRNTPGKAKYYNVVSKLPLIPYFQRKFSVSREMVKNWRDVVESGKLGNILSPSPDFKVPKDIEERWCLVPERIGSEPFVEEHVTPILLDKQCHPIQYKLVSQIINNLYFSTYTFELNAGIVQNLVYLETRHNIVSYGTDIYFRAILETLINVKKLKKIDFIDPLSIFEFRNSACWQKLILKSEHLNKLDFNEEVLVLDDNIEQSGHIRNKIAKIGIITIREDEYSAVTDRLPGVAWKGLKTNASYHRSGNIYIMSCIDQGEGEAQLVASKMALDLDPSLILLVGIGGAVPENEFSLGDVIVSTRILDMCTEAALEGNENEIAMTGGPLHPKINDLLRIFPTIVKSMGHWNSVEAIGCSMPEVHIVPKNLYGDRAWREKVKSSLKINFPEDKPQRDRKAMSGAIASGDKLVKNTSLIKKWKKHARQVVAVEMEAAGVYRLATDKSIPFAAIRGISDIVGFKREHEWTSFASNAAASFAISFIKHPHVISTLLD